MPADRLWVCHEHRMIGDRDQADTHRAEKGCDVAELSQEQSDGVRAEWAKEATFWDPAIAATLLLRARDVPEADSPSHSTGSPFGV